SIFLNNALYQGTANLNLSSNQTVHMNNNTVTGPAQLAGGVTLKGNYTVSTGGNATIVGNDFSVLGGSIGTATPEAKSGEELNVVDTLNVLSTGAILIKGGTAGAGSASESGARVAGRTVRVNGAKSLTIEGGT